MCTISVVHSAAGRPSRAHTTWTREAPTMAQATTMAHAMKTTLRPLHDRVLVKRLDEQDEKHGSLIIPHAVMVTVGPQWRNDVIAKKFGSPTITKDGVTVAKEIALKDPNQDLGAQMIKEVAAKSSYVAGDGTTTATVLAQAIFREGLKNVTAGANPMGLKRGIEQAVDTVVEELEHMSKATKDKKEIAQVATSAANNDKTIGDLIAEAMEKVGKDGVITVEEARAMETTLEVGEGMQFDRGYLSPYFVTDPE